MQFPKKHELHSSGSAAGKPQNQFQMFSPCVSRKGVSGKLGAECPCFYLLLEFPFAVCVASLGSLGKVLRAPESFLAVHSPSHWSVRTCCSELVSFCKRSPLSCCSGSKSNSAGKVSQPGWGGASCRTPSGEHSSLCGHLHPM